MVARGARQRGIPVIGFLSGRSQHEASGDTAAFHQGSNEMGYVDGRNVAIEYRWAEGRNEPLPDLAVDLVRRQVAVLAAAGGKGANPADLPVQQPAKFALSSIARTPRLSG